MNEDFGHDRLQLGVEILVGAVWSHVLDDVSNDGVHLTFLQGHGTFETVVLLTHILAKVNLIMFSGNKNLTLKCLTTYSIHTSAHVMYSCKTKYLLNNVTYIEPKSSRCKYMFCHGTSLDAELQANTVPGSDLGQLEFHDDLPHVVEHSEFLVFRRVSHHQARTQTPVQQVLCTGKKGCCALSGEFNTASRCFNRFLHSGASSVYALREYLIISCRGGGHDLKVHFFFKT